MVFHVILVLFVWSFLAVVVSNPHYVDPDALQRILEESLNEQNIRSWTTGIERQKIDGKPRFCQKCHFLKPDRAHHCSICKKCVLKMDHHCFWIANCVGYGNYRLFFLFIFYGMMYCLTLFMSCVYLLARLKHVQELLQFSGHFIMVLCFSTVFGILLLGMFCTHLFLVLTNRTTIESLSGHQVFYIENEFKVMDSSTNIYDLGYMRNFEQVFGPDKRFWLIPVSLNQQDGYRWPINWGLVYIDGQEI